MGSPFHFRQASLQLQRSRPNPRRYQYVFPAYGNSEHTDGGAVIVMGKEEKTLKKHQKYRFAIGGKKTLMDIVVPLNLKIQSKKTSIIVIQFLTAILTTVLFIFLFSIILREHGNHGVLLLAVESIIFIIYLIFSMKFIDMTFANLWVQLFEGGVRIIIEEDGIIDSRVSAKKINFSNINSAKTLSMPLPGTGGVSINVSKYQVEIRKFRFFYNIYGIFLSKNLNIFLETKYFSISSSTIAETIIELLQNSDERKRAVPELHDVGG